MFINVVSCDEGMQKRGVVELQVSWLFALIVGALILLFFGGVVMRQKTSTDIAISGDVLADLEAIFSGSLVSPNTVNTIDMPDVEITVDCNEFRIGDVSKQIGPWAVFSPSQLKGKKLITWTQEFNMPFLVQNFLYVTTKDVRYIFVNDTTGFSGEQKKKFETFLGEVLRNLPKEMTVTNLTLKVDSVPINTDPKKGQVAPHTLNDIEDLNDFRVRVVFFGTKPASYVLPANLASLDPTSVSMLWVDVNDLATAGKTVQNAQMKLYFWKKGGKTFEKMKTDNEGLMLLDEPSLYGAIFADGNTEFSTKPSEQYVCMMKKGFQRLNYMAKLKEKYYQKVYDPSSSTISQSCKESPNPQASFNELKTSSNACVTKYDSPCVIQMRNQLDESKTTNLRYYNAVYQQLSCPLMY